MDHTLHHKIATLRILLVDDDDFALRIIRHILYGLGITYIKEAFDGENASTVLGKHKFDLIITDVDMPKTNGLELLKQVRCGQTLAKRETPVIIVTSLSNSHVLQTSVALDVNGFLVKPMKPVVVQQKLGKAVAESERAVVKPVTDYQPIITSLKLEPQHEDEDKDKVNARIVLNEAKSKTPSDFTQQGVRHYYIRDLKPGMEVVHDIYLSDRTLLLSSGSHLTETIINRLHDLHEVLEVELVSVRESAGNSQAEGE